MKRFFYGIFSVFIFFSITFHVSAECSTSDLNELKKEAGKVVASHVEKEGEYDPGTYSPPEGLSDEDLENYKATYLYFEINIFNLTENLYIKVYNDVTGETNTYYYSDSDEGTIRFDFKRIKRIGKNTITVYASENTNCANMELYSFTYSTPRFNEYSTYSLCNNNPDFYLCYRFLTVETNIEFEEFVNAITRYEKGKIDNQGNEIPPEEPKEEKNFGTFLKENKFVLIGVTTGVIILGGTITFFIIKKKRSKKHEEVL